ncbi:MAG: ATP-binding protein [Acidimicrobiia bacterium]
MPIEEFIAKPESVVAVRTFVRDFLGEAPYVDDVTLVASELATNVVNHARTDFTVEIAQNTQVTLTVSDGSSIIPAVEDLTSDQRGLKIVERISSEWGIETTPTGKAIWAKFPTR